MNIELKSWENVSEFITLVNERFTEIYNQRIICSDIEEDSIAESYQIYLANLIQSFIPSLVVVMFQNGNYGYLYNSTLLDFYGNPVYEEKYILIPDMNFELLQGDTMGNCDPLRNRVWNSLEKEMYLDGMILLETVKHRSFVRKRVVQQ